MSWLTRLCGQQSPENIRQNSNNIKKAAMEESMSPGLTGEYDWDLREKAGVHQPPTLPEYMGLEGEYDINGLAKRVAVAFDNNPEIDDISTLSIIQDGSTIIFRGSVPNKSILNSIIDTASRVDGTKTVNTSQVTIEDKS